MGANKGYPPGPPEIFPAGFFFLKENGMPLEAAARMEA